MCGEGVSASGISGEGSEGGSYLQHPSGLLSLTCESHFVHKKTKANDSFSTAVQSGFAHTFSLQRAAITPNIIQGKIKSFKIRIKYFFIINCIISHHTIYYCMLP